MARTLHNRVMIITGASSGIGAATAIECARAGMDVVLNARRAERLEDVARQVAQLGRRAEIVAGDVTEPCIAERMLDAADRAFGRFDAVFANAGYGFEKPMIDVSADELRQIFDVNFFAGVELLQKAARRLIQRKQPGHLLMCSSCLAKFTLPFHAPYCATKAAQTHVCHSMRRELAPHGIHVASVHPIGTATEFFEASAQYAARHGGTSRTAVKDTPGMFMQSSQRVGRAVVRSLSRPRPEVWTSMFVRFAAGLMTISPRFADFCMRRMTQ